MDTNIKDPMDKLLARWEKEKKDKHGNNSHKQRKYFFPFSLSVDDMIGKEAILILTNLSRLVATKIKHVFGWVNTCITIAFERF